MNTPVNDLLEVKGRAVITIGPGNSVFEAIQRMADNSCGCLLVVKKSGKMAGIISERDCFRKVILAEKSPHKVDVKDVMTKMPKVITVTADKTVEECMAIMTNNRFRHLPVMKGDKPIGLISIGDVVKFLVSEQQIMIKNLEKYIEGSL
jgi:CBS domain-containing protein